MPWHVVENHTECAGSKSWAVVQDDTDELMGCHASEDDASKQVAALYAAEESAAAAGMSVSFHLPGKHDQSSHGRKGKGSVGKKLPSVSSPGSSDANTKTSSGMSREEFGKKARKASTGRKAYSKTPITGTLDLNDAADSDGKINGVSTHEIASALRTGAGNLNYADASRNLAKNNGNVSKLSAEDQEKVKALDAGLNASKLTGDILTYDATVFPETFFGDAWNSDGDNSGLTWVNHGYTSTSVKRDWGSGFENSPNRTEITYLLPKGTPAMGTDVNVKNAMSKNGDGEILAQRGLKFRVVSDSGKPQSMLGTRLITVEVVN